MLLKTIQSDKVRIGDASVYQPIPSQEIEMLDPYLLLHHWKNVLPGGQEAMQLGVPPHPHRGFSPVTFVFSGAARHRDSLGNDMVVGPGGMQWMSSGSGIIHSERPADKLAKKGGLFEIVQLWINTPKKDKKNAPYYMPLEASQTPRMAMSGGGATLYIYVGGIGEVTSPVEADGVCCFRIDMAKGAEITLPVVEGQTPSLYLLDGEIQLDKKIKAGERTFSVWEAGTSEVNIKAMADSRMLFLSGKPLGEPVAARGPFVMTTQKELSEAVKDYEAGKMGSLIEK